MARGYTMVGGSGTTTGTFPPLDLTTSYVSDDFLGGGSSEYTSSTDVSRHGSLGQLGWVLADSAHNRAGGHAIPMQGVINNDEYHPGYLQLYTDGSNNSAALHLGIGTGFSPNRTFTLRWVFRVDDPAATGIALQIGAMYASASVASRPTPGFHLSFDPQASSPAETTWWARWFDDLNVLHEVDTGLAPDTAWHLLDIKHTAGVNSLLFYVDGVLKATITSFTHTDLLASVNGLADVWGDGILYVDYYDCLVSGLTRYTPA